MSRRNATEYPLGGGVINESFQFGDPLLSNSNPPPAVNFGYMYGRPSPLKIQGCQVDQQIQSWFKDQLQDRIAKKGMAWPNYRRFSFPS